MSLKYYPHMDGLRAVAISFVLIEHFGGFLGQFVKGGYYGVDLFFVISGFLITQILLKNSSQPFLGAYKQFLGRRTLRIFPIYYLCVIFLIIINMPPARELSAYLFTYTFNYAAANYQIAGNENPLFYLWSLSLEEQFYLFWPLIVLNLRNRKGVLLGIILGIVLIGYAQILFNIFPFFVKYNYVGLLSRMGSLGLGALGALWMSFRKLPDWLLTNKWLELLMLGVLGWSVASVTTFRYWPFLLGLASLFFVLKATSGSFCFKLLETFLRNKAVVYFGKISYGVYIFHIPIQHYFSQFIFDPIWLTIPFEGLGIFSKVRFHSWIIKLPLYTALTIAVASFSYSKIESPILKLKDRFFKY